jgi:hypothetical protein
MKEFKVFVMVVITAFVASWKVSSSPIVLPGEPYEKMKPEEVQTYLADLWSTDAVTVYITTASPDCTFRSLKVRWAHGAEGESVQGSWRIIAPPSLKKLHDKYRLGLKGEQPPKGIEIESVHFKGDLQSRNTILKIAEEYRGHLKDARLSCSICEPGKGVGYEKFAEGVEFFQVGITVTKIVGKQAERGLDRYRPGGVTVKTDFSVTEVESEKKALAKMRELQALAEREFFSRLRTNYRFYFRIVDDKMIKEKRGPHHAEMDNIWTWGPDG